MVFASVCAPPACENLAPFVSVEEETAVRRDLTRSADWQAYFASLFCASAYTQAHLQRTYVYIDGMSYVFLYHVLCCEHVQNVVK